MHQKYTGIIAEALTLISQKHDSKNKVLYFGDLPLQIHLKNFPSGKHVLCNFTMNMFIVHAQSSLKPYTEIFTGTHHPFCYRKVGVF